MPMEPTQVIEQAVSVEVGGAVTHGLVGAAPAQGQLIVALEEG